MEEDVFVASIDVSVQAVDSVSVASGDDDDDDDDETVVWILQPAGQGYMA